MAASIVAMPASRISFTSRSCNVPNARSTRPLACGLFAQDVDIQRLQRTAELGDALTTFAVVHPKDVVLVAIERDRLAVSLQVGTRGAEVVERQFRDDKSQHHQPTGRIIDQRQQCACWTTVFEPGVLRSVDLHQLAQTLTPPARLMRRGQAMPAIHPQPVRDHPLPQRLIPSPRDADFIEGFPDAGVI